MHAPIARYTVNNGRKSGIHLTKTGRTTVARLTAAKTNLSMRGQTHVL